MKLQSTKKTIKQFSKRVNGIQLKFIASLKNCFSLNFLASNKARLFVFSILTRNVYKLRDFILKSR